MEAFTLEEYKEKFLQLQQEMATKMREKDVQLETLKKDKEMLELRLKVMADEVESCKKHTKSLQDDYVLVITSLKSKLQQRISDYENAIKLSPDSTVMHLQNKIKTLTEDLVAKDQLLEKMKQSSSSYYVAEPSSLLKLLEKEKETKRALQAHISFLSQELERIEHEMRRQRNDDTMVKLKEELPATLLTGETQDQLQIKVWTLQQEMKSLREIYFMSLGRALKLQGSLFGWFVNLSIHEMYEEALENNIPLEKWPSWITSKMQAASVQTTPAETDQTVTPPTPAS